MRDDTLANKKQCHVLRQMIDNHSNRVLSSYMKGNVMIVETEDGEKCFVLPDGNKHPKLYYIEQQCLKCPACDNTGWKRIDIATSRDQSKKMRKHWQHYLGRKIKVRINNGQN